MRIPGPSKEEGARDTADRTGTRHRIPESTTPRTKLEAVGPGAQTDAHGGDERAPENALQKLLTVIQLFGHIVLIL